MLQMHSFFSFLIFSSFNFIAGYCNSAINPMIYALFSKDFRFAFKRIICKCFCSGKSIFMTTSRRGSDMSAIRTTSSGQRTPSISPSHLAQSIGEDSEMGCDSEMLRWRSFAPSISSSYASSSPIGRPSIHINVNSVNNSNTINNNGSSNVNMNRRSSNPDDSSDGGTASTKTKCTNGNNEIELSSMMMNNIETSSNPTSGNAVRASNIYDICHPLVM